MAETTFFPRRLILGGAMISGVLLALAVHMLGARYGLDLGGLWRSDAHDFMPAGVLLLAGAGQAASAPSPIPTISGVLAGLAALCLGAVMAFCGANFALRKA